MCFYYLAAKRFFDRISGWFSDTYDSAKEGLSEFAGNAQEQLSELADNAGDLASNVGESISDTFDGDSSEDHKQSVKGEQNLDIPGDISLGSTGKCTDVVIDRIEWGKMPVWGEMPHGLISIPSTPTTV